MRSLLRCDRTTRFRIAWSAAVIALLIVLGTLLVAPAFSYVPLLTRSGGAANADHWDFSAFPVSFEINTSTHSNVKGNRAAADVIVASFGSWQSAPNASINVSRGP